MAAPAGATQVGIRVVRTTKDVIDVCRVDLATDRSDLTDPTVSAKNPSSDRLPIGRQII